jgi:glycosyltransferase involved in cell wall biosynthesis
MVALESRPLERPELAAAGRLRVGVLVDLVRSERAGGHVKCWERFAQAATNFSDRLDLTVHFTGPERSVEALAENVRFVTEPPLFSTARLPFLSHIPDDTDMAPWHPRLARWLESYDVIHTTDAFFAYARTATRVARRKGVPLVTSVHTNTPEYTRIYARQTVERLFGAGSVGRRLVLDRLIFPERAEELMRGRLKAHQAHCAHVLVSRPAELAPLQAQFGSRGGLLRRGIDRRLFNPARRDRGWLSARYGVPQDRAVVMFAGRLNLGKNVLLAAEAVSRLVARGLDIQLVCAGDGDQRAAIETKLGDRATLAGSLSPEIIARVYASADIFALPSQIEEAANVVPEALASGLPVLVAAEGGMGRMIREGETGFALPGEDAAAWAETIAALLGDPMRHHRMRFAARHYAETELPSWEEVLDQDLVPRWRDAAALRAPR